MVFSSGFLCQYSGVYYRACCHGGPGLSAVRLGLRSAAGDRGGSAIHTVSSSDNWLASASAAVDVAIHDTKILFPPVFPMLPDMSNRRFPHPDSAVARTEPGLGWLTDITARYLFKRTLYILKQKRAGATSTGQSVFPWDMTPLSFSDLQGWKVASI